MAGNFTGPAAFFHCRRPRLSYIPCPLDEGVGVPGRSPETIHREDFDMASTRVPMLPADIPSQSLQQKLEMSTAEIGLSVRTTNCLEETGIFTVKDLLHKRPDDLLSISNFGVKTLDEVYRALDRIGFRRPGKRCAAR
jgi:DNA-directed RNA polymerase subunit alpha